MNSKPLCYNCIFRYDVPGSAHSECGRNFTDSKPPVFADYGITKGWVDFPTNFDPVWLLRDECSGFEVIAPADIKFEVQQLLDVYKAHGSIIIGVDFDDTIFPYTADDTGWISARCDTTVDVLKKVQKYAKLCLWTISESSTLIYKEYIAQSLGLDIKYINESPVKFFDAKKPYFNILVDDKAGLLDVLDTLNQFIEIMKNN